MFVNLFFCNFSSNSTTFHSFGYIIISGKRLQVLTHLWSFRNKGSLMYHIYCDKVHTLIMVISEDASDIGAVTSCFNDLGLRCWVSNTQPCACGANALSDYEKTHFWIDTEIGWQTDSKMESCYSLMQLPCKYIAYIQKKLQIWILQFDAIQWYLYLILNGCFMYIGVWVWKNGVYCLPKIK